MENVDYVRQKQSRVSLSIHVKVSAGFILLP